MVGSRARVMWRCRGWGTKVGEVGCCDRGETHWTRLVPGFVTPAHREFLSH